MSDEETKPRVKLSIQSPDMRDRDTGFSIDMPRYLAEEEVVFLRDQIEFRRKCMNQGFDNLLDLLDKHFKHFQKAEAIRSKRDNKEQP